MDESGAWNGPQPGIVGEQSIEKRPVAIARTGMDHEAGGLVEHQQVRVLVENGKRSRLCSRHLVALDFAVDTDSLAAQDPVPRPSGGSVEGGGAGPDPLLDPGPGMLRKDPGERLVGPQPAQYAGYDSIESNVLRHRRSRRISPRGRDIIGSPAATAWTGIPAPAAGGLGMGLVILLVFRHDTDRASHPSRCRRRGVRRVRHVGRGVGPDQGLVRAASL